MAGERAKGGKKNRKHGRWLRSPAMKRWKAEGRLAVNKARRIARAERLRAKRI